MSVAVLGPIRVLDGGGRDVTPVGALQRRLLALLVLHRGRVVSTEAAIEALWPGRRPRNPLAALQNHLSRLRQELPEGVVESVGDDPTRTERRACPGRLLYATPTVEHLERFGLLYERLGIYMSDRRPVGVPADRLAAHVRLDGWQLDRKLTALRAMATQTSEAVAALDREPQAAQIIEESFVEAARTTATPADDVPW